MAVRMFSMETTSAEAAADDPDEPVDPENEEARGDSITIGGESGSESKSSAPR